MIIRIQSNSAFRDTAIDWLLDIMPCLISPCMIYVCAQLLHLFPFVKKTYTGMYLNIIEVSHIRGLMEVFGSQKIYPFGENKRGGA